MTRRAIPTSGDRQAGRARIGSLTVRITRRTNTAVSLLKRYADRSSVTGVEAMDALEAMRTADDEINALVWQLLTAVAQTGVSMASISARTGIPLRTLSRHLAVKEVA